MKKRGELLSWSLLILFMVTSVAHGAEKIKTAGSSTILPIVKDAAKAFKQSHPDVSFFVIGGGSTHGVQSVGTDMVNIGHASRDLKDKEMKKFPNLVPFKIGLDGIAIIVSSTNPLNGVNKKQIQDIYTGKISNWKELGGDNTPIQLISKEKGRATLDLFLKYVDLEAKETGEGQSKSMIHKTKGDADFSTIEAKLIGPNKEAIATVSTKPNSIAYVSIGTALEIIQKGGRIKLLDLEGVKASIQNVKNDTYPLRRPLNLVTNGQPQGIVKEFIDFLQSENGQKIVKSHEFITVTDYNHQKI